MMLHKPQYLNQSIRRTSRYISTRTHARASHNFTIYKRFNRPSTTKFSQHMT